jgi:hypothetical protein
MSLEYQKYFEYEFAEILIVVASFDQVQRA